ncbi:MAG: hypothetical protein J6A05_06500 [Oscillospiraceae bacterium]|nr:hypothetical protein [Oscillospiraceae bacterium]
MRRVVPVLLLICICLMSLTGCSLKKVVELDGREQVEAFVAEAKTWQSGRYLLTNVVTGETDQVFSFMNNADGTQSYLYERLVDGVIFVEYSDGVRYYKSDAEVVAIYDDGTGICTTENPHPYSTGDLLFYVNLYALGSSSETDDEGNVTYTYIYDTAKINEALGTALSSFSTTYTFDKDGNFLYFTQKNSDGVSGYSYMIEIIDENAITELENPVV